MRLCRELAAWIRALVSLSVPWLGVGERHSAVLAALQWVETLFPALARRIAFRFLAHGAVRCRDGSCMHNLGNCYYNGSEEVCGFLKEEGRRLLGSEGG